LISLVFVLLLFVHAGHSDPFDTWTLGYQSPPFVTLSEVACGNGLFIAVGFAGTNLVSETSSDGVNWIMHEPAPLPDKLVYGNGLFVAAGSEGPATSADGLTWVLQKSQAWTNGFLSGIGYGNGLFVVLGGFGLGGSNATTCILTSQDGTNWVRHQLPISNELDSIAYGNGQFVAVGPSQIATSTDGTNWVLRNSGGLPYLNAIAYGNGQFVAGGNYGSEVIASADGTAWTAHQSAANGISTVAFGNGQFVAVEFGGGQIMSSADGVTWVRRFTGAWAVNRVAFGNGQFVAIGERAILTSRDGANWTLRQSGCQGQVGRLGYLGGEFVALSDCGTILTSTDGTTWMQHLTGDQVPQASLSAITYGNGQFVASSASNIVTSTDGTSWIQHPSPTPFGLYEIAYGSGQFVGLAQDETGTTNIFFSSPDGTNWTPRFVVSWPWTFSSQGFNSIVYANGQFVAVGGWEDLSSGASQANIATSTDGMHWTPQQLTATTNILRGVTYGRGQFVAVGGHVIVYDGYPHVGEDIGSIITSADGTNWVLQLDGVIGDQVAYGNGQFIVASHWSTILASSDGLNWTQHRLVQPSWQRYPGPLTYGNGHFVFCNRNGYDNSIWQSGSIIMLSILPRTAPGLLSLYLEGPTGLDYTIQRSTDLIYWQTVTNISSAQPTNIIFNALPACRTMFYRAYSQ
jgi:hypothetical protein